MFKAAQQDNIFDTTYIRDLEACDEKADMARAIKLLQQAKADGINFSACRKGRSALSYFITKKKSLAIFAILDYVNIPTLFQCDEFFLLLRIYLEDSSEIRLSNIEDIINKFIAVANTIGQQKTHSDAHPTILLQILENPVFLESVKTLLQKGMDPNEVHGFEGRTSTVYFGESLICRALSRCNWELALTILEYSKVKVDLPTHINNVKLLQYLANNLQGILFSKVIEIEQLDHNLVCSELTGCDILNDPDLDLPDDIIAYKSFRDTIENSLHHVSERKIEALMTENAKLKKRVQELEAVVLQAQNSKPLTDTQESSSKPTFFSQRAP